MIWFSLRASLAFVAFVVVASPLAAAPILEYTFETNASTGTDTTAISYFNGAGASAPGAGVTGGLGLASSATDRAYSSGTQGGAHARHTADNNNIDALASFTISGWYRVATAPGGRIVQNFDGMELIGGANLTMNVDAVNAASTGNTYAAADTWVFFAIAYDGTQTANNLKFYRGFRNDAEAQAVGAAGAALTLVTTVTNNRGTTNDNSGPLAIGNRLGGFGGVSTPDRPFQGLLDNLRIHGSKTDASGALASADLESLRANDVPEPAAIALLGLGALLMLPRRRG